MQLQELLDIVEKEEIHIMMPGMEQWQDEGCYTAYKNIGDGVILKENKNPVQAILEVATELSEFRKKS